MIPRSFIAGVVALSASAAHANTVASQDNLSLSLSCAGIMFTGTDGATESRITTLGLIDIEHKRAGGFGIGRVPVAFVSASEVRFGSSTVDETGQPIEGVFNRATGEMTIAVRSQKRPAEILIRMELSCRITEPVS
jgi:hypothetical protein